MTEPKKLTISQLKLEQLISNPAVMMIGKRGSGVSTMVKHFLQSKNIVPDLVFNPTEKFSSFYSEFVPKENIFCWDQWDQNDNDKKFLTVNDLIDTRFGEILLNASRDLQNQAPRNRFLVFDGIHSKELFGLLESPNFRELLMNGRHYQIGFILTSQYAYEIPPEIKLNMDYYYLFGNQSIPQRKNLFRDYGFIFPSFNVFEIVFDKCTKNYSTMVINNRYHCGKIEEKIFWSKASIPDKDINIDLTVTENITESESESDIDSDQDLDVNFKTDPIKKYYNEISHFPLPIPHQKTDVSSTQNTYFGNLYNYFTQYICC